MIENRIITFQNQETVHKRKYISFTIFLNSYTSIFMYINVVGKGEKDFQGLGWDFLIFFRNSIMYCGKVESFRDVNQGNLFQFLITSV